MLYKAAEIENEEKYIKLEFIFKVGIKGNTFYLTKNVGNEQFRFHTLQ